VLELGCGTGRVAIPIAEQGGEVVGLDLSPFIMEIARKKSAGLKNLHWVQGDMRSFELQETFGLITIPGHAFQNLVTVEDQVTCLESIHNHLLPAGKLIIHLDHQSFSWLGDLMGEKGGVFQSSGEFIHPDSSRRVRTWRAWSFEPASQTAIAETIWEVFGTDGQVIERLESGPIRLHCAFRFEIEHFLARCGFNLEAVYGDFLGNELLDDSEEMVWLAVKTL
jgi:SAM-dependent methyltransferase